MSLPFLRAQLRDPAFRQGVSDMAGTCLGIGAWGLVTGVAMAKSGMSLPMALFMSLAVYAGSAQLAVLPLMVAGAPLWVVWLTATCVNLRFVIFSSMWRSYFAHLPRRRRMALGYFSGDVIFVSFMKRYPQPEPEATLARELASAPDAPAAPLSRGDEPSSPPPLAASPDPAMRRRSASS